MLINIYTIIYDTISIQFLVNLFQESSHFWIVANVCIYRIQYISTITKPILFWEFSFF